MPPSFAMALALETNGSVQMTATGTPFFSRETASCTLHDEHDPQSPEDVITTSHRSTRSSRISPGQGREALPLFLAITSPNS